MSFIVNFFKDIVQTMLELFSFSRKKISNKLSIFIKTTNGKSLSVDLDPKWDIEKVKELVAPQLGLQPNEVKIIFAGKELEDSTTISVSWKLFESWIKSLKFFIMDRNVTWDNKASCMQWKQGHASTTQ